MNSPLVLVFCTTFLPLTVLQNSEPHTETVNFCRIKCGNERHTICILEHNCGIGSRCENFTWKPLTNTEKKAVLDLHNSIRNSVALGKGLQRTNGEQQPKASDMLEVVWDVELEFSAQCYANQCPTHSDKCRSKSDGTPVGQNLAYFLHDNDTLGTINRWYGEGKHLTTKQLYSYEETKTGPIIGHYTQMVHSATYMLGCGRSSFVIENWDKTVNLLVCHYAPAGNVLGQNVYDIGKPARNCPEGNEVHSRYKGLCASKSVQQVVPRICQFSPYENCSEYGERPALLIRKNTPVKNAQTSGIHEPKRSTTVRKLSQATTDGNELFEIEPTESSIITDKSVVDSNRGSETEDVPLKITIEIGAGTKGSIAEFHESEIKTVSEESAIETRTTLGTVETDIGVQESEKRCIIERKIIVIDGCSGSTRKPMEYRYLIGLAIFTTVMTLN